MFKIVALAAFIGACHAAEHAYSSQSIIRYDNNNQKHDIKTVKYQVPVKYDVPVKYEVPAKYAVPVKYEIPVVTHKFVPVLTSVLKAVPVAHYVSESSGHGHGHVDSHHAVSSSHIQREDIPAEAPKDFYVEYGHPKYEFEYKVEDPHTKDNKFQHEARDGHVVKGIYSLHEADGSIRTVEYFADKHTGFIADVKHVTKHVEKHHN